jgi:hypothetical protein
MECMGERLVVCAHASLVAFKCLIDKIVQFGHFKLTYQYAYMRASVARG